MNVITTGQHVAGVHYAAIVGVYRATINAPGTPRSTGNGTRCLVEKSGLANACIDREDPEECHCLKQRQRYGAAYAALFAAGQRAARVVARVAVFDEWIAKQDIVHLQKGLTALEHHFALT